MIKLKITDSCESITWYLRNKGNLTLSPLRATIVVFVVLRADQITNIGNKMSV